MDKTVAILKPHILRNTYAFEKILEIIHKNFKVVNSKEIHITKQISERLYAEHKEKFFYDRLVTYMAR